MNRFCLLSTQFFNISNSIIFNSVTTKQNLHEIKIKAIRLVANGVYVLSFQRDFTFSAGQVIAIDLIPDGKPRLYSIASGENDKDIEILFDEKPDGKLTPFLSKLKSGDSLFVSEPFGTFYSNNKPAYWIAAGTGIAPFVSMTKSGFSKNKILIHGGRNDENFYFSSELKNTLNDRYIRCCSQQKDTAYFSGRLTEWLKAQESFPVDIHYFLCGSAEMVVQVRDILINKGIAFQQIISETYF